nr:hypothetical protein BaRGS_033737 [Batillaria attramentaria]
MPPDPSIKIEDDKRVPVPNVVLTVKVFRPKLQTSVVPKGETFQVLGTQKLTDLRDSITCVKDDAVAGDFSDYPLVPKEALTPARNIYKSGLFFIEDTFYNDMREPDNRDYSAPIREWAAKKNEQGADNFRTAKMEDTTFNDLEIQFGAPYLYQHQGNCEHLMVFTDLRLLHPDDPQSITMYPHLVSETVNKRTLCREKGKATVTAIVEPGVCQCTHVSALVFVVDVWVSGRHHVVERRYTEFEELHKQVKKMMKTPEFPPKKVLKWNSKVLEQRQRGLEAYLQGVVSYEAIPKAILHFLEIRDEDEGIE